MNVKSISCTACVCVFTSIVVYAEAPQYTVTDLGVIPTNFVYATGTGPSINSKGYIAGANNVVLNDPTKRAQIGIPGNGVININATLGGSYSDGNAINEFDHITGRSSTTDYQNSNGEPHAFIWDGTSMTDLGTLGGLESFGYAINNLDRVTGDSRIASGDRHAFFWDGSTMDDLGTLGGNFSSGRGISNNGMVTGLAQLSNGLDHAFLWDGAIMQDLGTLGGSKSVGNAVNDQGMVAGWSELIDGTHPVATLWENNEIINLGTLGGLQSNAKSINSDGFVAGWADIAGGTDHGFVWDGVKMNDLSPLPGHVLSQAWLITDDGSVLGFSTDGENASHIVKWDLTTVPIPSAVWFFGSGLLGLIAVARRKAA